MKRYLMQPDESLTSISVASRKVMRFLTSPLLRGKPGKPGNNGIGIPVGGQLGQILFKDSQNEDYKLRWADALNNSFLAHNVTQNAHGFQPEQLVRLEDGEYVLAQADNVFHATPVGMVTKVLDANRFELATNGYLSGLANKAPGAVYFLSATTPGALTITEPTGAGHVSLPVLTAETLTTGYLNIQRGQEL